MKHLSWLCVFLIAVTLINYPNPFNPKGNEITTFECTTDTTAEAFLHIYDMAARRILRKAFNLQGGTAVKTTWNGYSDYNEQVGNGLYLYQIIDIANNRVGKGKIWVVNQ